MAGGAPRGQPLNPYLIQTKCLQGNGSTPLASQLQVLHFVVLLVRDVIKDEIGGKLPSGRPQTSSGRPRLPRGRGFTCGRVFTVRGRGKNRVHADAKFFIFYFLFFYFFQKKFW
jgi:hypothetical protein